MRTRWRAQHDALRRFPTALRGLAPLRLCVLSACTALPGGACSRAPPADFAPDPGLVEQIRDIRIIPAGGRACPGTKIPANYDAVLADGSRVPFARSYDKKHPPRLHVVFLDRESPDAVSRADGDWVTERDPLATASTGFRLTATLRARPSVTSTVILPPDYACMRHRFTFSGAPGGIGGTRGSDGPDVTARVAMVRSPFYDKLYVTAIEVHGDTPFYILGDASSVAGANWLSIESEGGSGGEGLPGLNGTDGAPGAPGCPGQPGWPGWNGGNGGAGGSGGSGGRITIVIPIEQPFLADLVESHSGGGAGGSGGPGGNGGRGGRGGVGLFDANNQPCGDGPAATPGNPGSKGLDGSPGAPGPRSTVATAHMRDLFGERVPPGLAALLDGRQQAP